MNDWATRLAIGLFVAWFLMCLGIMRWFRVTVGRPAPRPPGYTARRLRRRQRVNS